MLNESGKEGPLEIIDGAVAPRYEFCVGSV